MERMSAAVIIKFWRTATSRARETALLVALWALTMIALPIVRWTLGEAALQRGIAVGVLVQVLVVMVILARAWGFARALSAGALVSILAWSAEALGSATGFPFGAYHYTEVLQPQFVGVPLLIPLAWLMMLPPAWAVGWLLTKPQVNGASRQGAPRFPFRFRWAFASALAFTAWDLFLDPQMVAWNFWQWDQPGGYFGIPWVNFLGWALVAWLVSLAASFVFRPERLPATPLLVVYIITWLLQTIGQVFFWGLPGPGLVGFIGMGAVLAAAGLRRRSLGPQMHTDRNR
jgi:lycopene beta-cyclase